MPGTNISLSAEHWQGRPKDVRGVRMITQCSHCQAQFKARADLIGKEIPCPRCKKAFIVAEFAVKPAASGAEVEKPSGGTCSRCGAAISAGGASGVYEGKAVCPKCHSRLTRAKQPSKAPDSTREMPESEGLSDTIYVYSVACALAVGIFALFLGQLAIRERDREFVVFGGVLIVIGAALGIYSTVVRFVLYYKMWAAIQDGHARASPVKAVGLLLAPVFNIFWAIYMFVGFAADFESFAGRHSLRTERPSKALLIQYALLWIFLDISFVVLYVLPFFGIGSRLFGGVYASFGSGGNFRYVVMAWKMSNIACTVWLLTIYVGLSTRICRALNAI